MIATRQRRLTDLTNDYDTPPWGQAPERVRKNVNTSDSPAYFRAPPKILPAV